MTEVVFRKRKMNIEKILSFGFAEQDGCYVYTADLVNGQMKMIVTASKDGKLCTEVIDNSSGDEYVLHLIASAVGSFVGQVKTEYEAILEEISRKCFEPDVFKNNQAKSVIAYVRDTYGDELEFLWQKFSDNAIWRRKDNKKWYAALLTVSKKKLGFDADEQIEILDLRMKPEDIETLVDNKKYFPGYHMNKKHWITICLDGTVSCEEIYARIGESYKLAVK